MSEIFTGQVDLAKALGETSVAGQNFEDISQAEALRTQVKPSLASALFGPATVSEGLMTDTFRFSTKEANLVIPTEKRFDERGNTITQDKGQTHRFGVVSRGLKHNVAPADYVGKFKWGTQDLLTEADVVADLNDKAMASFALLDELMYMTPIASGLEYGGDQVDWMNAITGTSRTAAIAMDIANSTTAHRDAEIHVKALAQEVERSGQSMSGVIALCGDSYFNDRRTVEENANLSRDLKFGTDLASEPILSSSFGSGTFNYQYFQASDGILYINYGATILAGSKMVADDEAHLIPVGTSRLFSAAYAPSQTRTYANTQGQAMYAWSNFDDFAGVTTMYESNKLIMPRNPRLFITLKRGA